MAPLLASRHEKFLLEQTLTLSTECLKGTLSQVITTVRDVAMYVKRSSYCGLTVCSRSSLSISVTTQSMHMAASGSGSATPFAASYRATGRRPSASYCAHSPQ